VKKYHIVWCPKYRRKVLVDGVADRLNELIREVCKEIQVEIIEMEIMPDHIHLLLEVDSQFGVHKAIKKSKDVRREFCDKNLIFCEQNCRHFGQTVILFQQWAVRL